MKKLKSLFAAGAMLFAASAAANAVEIGVIGFQFSSETHARVANAAAAAAKAKGWTVTLLNSEGALPKHAEQFDALIAKKVDAIVIAMGKPVEADTVTLPERDTAVDQAAKRTAMLWLRLPLCGTRVRALAPKLTPSVDNSKPAGALTLTLPGNPPPLTVKLCGAEAMPTRADIAGNVLVLTESAGITVPLNLTMRLVVLSVETTKSPNRGPLGALAARRTAMAVGATALLLRESVRLVPKLVRPVPNRAIS
jgi:hypothetical protein